MAKKFSVTPNDAMKKFANIQFKFVKFKSKKDGLLHFEVFDQYHEGSDFVNVEETWKNIVIKFSQQ